MASAIANRVHPLSRIKLGKHGAVSIGLWTPLAGAAQALIMLETGGAGRALILPE